MEIDVRRKQGDFLVDARFTGADAGVTALFGPSGAGKTSVINMVAGLIRPDAGKISVNGLDLFDSDRNIDLPPEKRRVGYVFQDGRLLPHLSVRANLTYGMRLLPNNRRFVKMDQVTDLLGIGHLLSRRPAGLSGGEKQRVAIGRALLTSPAVLLMDEPLASLDGPRKAEVSPFIKELGQRFSIPVLYVTHALEEILNLASAMVVMDAGRVAVHGSLEDVLSRPDMGRLLDREDWGTVISARVDGPKDVSGLTGLRSGKLVLRAGGITAPVGTGVRVRIPARHVALALTAPKDTSFRNIFSGIVKEIRDTDNPFVDVGLDVGLTKDRPLWARITRQSLADLNLAPGGPAFALVKSIAVLGGDG